MSTTTLGGTSRIHRHSHRMDRTARTGIRVGRLGIGSVALMAVLVSAWGGIAPYVGPAFGWDAASTSSWHWNLAHSLLALVPGAVGVAIGLIVLAETRGVTVGRGRLSLAMAGLVLVLCGAWFVVGPFTWPVLLSGAYFTIASPLHELANTLGLSLGTGVLVAGSGAFILGWAARHQPATEQPGNAAARELPPPPVPEGL